MNDHIGEHDQTILVINSGSSSLKLTLFGKNKQKLTRLLDGHFKGLNTSKTSFEIEINKQIKKYPCPKKIHHQESLNLFLKLLQNNFHISMDSVAGVGHRFVHGGNKYLSSTLINSAKLKKLATLNYLAPLHNPACIEGIHSAIACFGKVVPQVVVFDTAFHKTLSEVTKTYAIPAQITKKYEIQRYGFHGISHHFLTQRYTETVQKKKFKLITIHLGNGCSICAIKDGASIDTSMGFTPLEGLVMGTRSGDIDPSLIEFLCIQEKKSVSEITTMLNVESGLMGISKDSSDMKDLLKQYKINSRARLAIDVFCYRIVKYIGSYIAILGGLDSIIFSGGIGENAPFIRSQILKMLHWFGFRFSNASNRNTVRLNPGMVTKISTNNSTVSIYVVGTDENLFIANEVNIFLNLK